MVTDNARVGRIIRNNPKAVSVLRDHLVVVNDDSYRRRAVQLVLGDWLGLGVDGKILQDTELTSEKLDALSREFRWEDRPPLR